jgi:basic membrane protein A
MRRLYAGALAAIAVVSAYAVAACAGGGLRVGLAYDIGGRGDKSFNDAAAVGLDRVRSELAGKVGQVRELSARNHESEQDKYERLKLLCGADFDVVIAVGYEYAGADAANGPLLRAAKECPDTLFAIVDDARVSAPNVADLVFADEQGSFLVGAAAALKTATGRVGFIGGCPNAVIRRFEAGFRAGVAAGRAGQAAGAGGEVAVSVRYLAGDERPCPGFTDPGGAEQAATDLYTVGADIVFHAAGASGEGLFRAAAAGPERWAIGVDSDQYVTVGPPLRDVILTSMVKRVDVAVFDLVKGVTDGSFTPGAHRFDLAGGGVGYATSGGRIDDIVPRLQELRQEIINGSRSVPVVPS